MTLALAAHTATAAPAFDGTFFSTAATVIPVLFLALTLQGTLFARADSAYFRAIRIALEPATGFGWKATTIFFAAMLLRLVLSLVLLAGTWGEALAIYALYQQQATAEAKQLVIQAVMVLIALTAIGPIIFSVSARIAAMRPQAPPPAWPRSRRHSPQRRSPGRPTPKWARPPHVQPAIPLQMASGQNWQGAPRRPGNSKT
jgi:hypothetical protein